MKEMMREMGKVEAKIKATTANPSNARADRLWFDHCTLEHQESWYNEI
jgi:hypothetical protein